MNDYSVLIAGAGPTGLMLAGELALAGIDVAIVERRATGELAGSRAGGLHARTLEVLDQRGIADRFLSQGRRHRSVGFHPVMLDIGDLPSRHACVLALPQQRAEELLTEWLDDFGVPILREREVLGFAQHGDGVDVALSDGTALRAEYLVGCDGGRSAVRKAAGIEFAGWEATTSWLIAELSMSEVPPWGFRDDVLGTHAVGPLDDGRRMRVVLTERELHVTGVPALHDVREALIAVYGTDFGAHTPTWISRFTDHTHQAAQYRNGRVLLAGDAAHVHPPLGGQGLNVGVQDAVNLGWKLAQVVRGTSPASLLDTYHDERHPVAARVLRGTMAQTALRRTDERALALRERFAAFLAMAEPRRSLGAELTGLDIHYDFGAGHPLLGRRMPDLDLQTGAGTRRLYTLLHGARAVLIDLGSGCSAAAAAWSDRVQTFAARCSGPWELPALGAVAAPVAVLVRPDGYVAWVGDGTRTGLAEALRHWFGPPGTARSDTRVAARPR